MYQKPGSTELSSGMEACLLSSMKQTKWRVGMERMRHLVDVFA
jgi:hypothetical protein